MFYKVVLQKGEEGYSVSCPGLPGCWSQGETEQEALVNIQDAISEYLAVVNESVKDLEVHEDLKQNIWRRSTICIWYQAGENLHDDFPQFDSHVSFNLHHESLHESFNLFALLYTRRFFKCLDRVQMIYAWKFRHLCGNLDFSHVGIF